MKRTCLLCLPVLVMLAVPCVAAETLYVTDQLVLTLRSAPTQDSEAVAYPRTDDPLQVLGEEGKYVHVRDGAGIEGYVLKQYLTTETPKQRIIEQLQRELAKTREQLESRTAGSQDQQQELQELRNTRDNLAAELEKARTELVQLKQSHEQLQADSKNLLEIVQERDRLRTERQSLEEEATTLRDENKSLLVAAMIKWFLAGAGVLLFGWILGKVSRKRQRPF